MNPLDRFDAKIQTLRSWVQRHPSNSVNFIDHKFVEAVPMGEAELAQIERQYDISLPTEYRALLRRFGDVDFGPGNVFYQVREGLTPASGQPFPLTAPFLGCSSPRHQQLSPDAQWEQYHFLLQEWETIPKDEGVLTICDYGCAMTAKLILAGDFRDRVWILAGDGAHYGPLDGSELLHDEVTPREWGPTETPRGYTFFEWYESWLDGQLRLTSL